MEEQRTINYITLNAMLGIAEKRNKQRQDELLEEKLRGKSEKEQYAEAKALLNTDQGDAAFKILKKLAENGYQNAIMDVADCYRYGEHTPQDHKAAFALYQKMADLGDWWAKCCCGKYFYYGWHGTKDVDEAVRIWKEAAALGSREAVILLNDMANGKL